MKNNNLIPKACRICGAVDVHQTYRIKEMMYGTQEEFEYYLCNHCQCMQIDTIPEELGKYYRGDYYSYQLDTDAIQFSGPPNAGPYILDVGCGTGQYLVNVAKEYGFGNLYGCDPFISQDITYGDRIFIRKSDITQMEGEYDTIRLGDSFEHMGNPLEVLQHIKRLLRPKGECYISMPLFPNAAFDTFGINWYQLDAPRHIYIQSRKSMEYLCSLAQLKIKEVIFDSNDSQFVRSYLYSQGIPFVEHTQEVFNQFFDKEDVDFFERNSEKVNEKEYGDHATFIIVKDLE